MKLQEQADIKYRKLSARIARNGVATINVYKDGEIVDIISNIKSVSQWGLGLFYGFRSNQKSFTKSVSLLDIAILPA